MTKLGGRQAECVAGAVSSRPTLIVTSGFLRTRETAGPLARRYDGVPWEFWDVHEFTYLNTAACTGTSYDERRSLREAYWERGDVEHVDGPGCESFAGFVERVRLLERGLSELGSGESVVVFSHGLVMRALLWLRGFGSAAVDSGAMGDFREMCRSVALPNCCILRGEVDGLGGIRFVGEPSVEHLPVELRTE